MMDFKTESSQVHKIQVKGKSRMPLVEGFEIQDDLDEGHDGGHPRYDRDLSYNT